jgi:hypothetical protein
MLLVELRLPITNDVGAENVLDFLANLDLGSIAD